jgi:hypothetical protein
VDLHGKRVDLDLLTKELTSAAVPHNGLGTHGDPPDDALWTFDADGAFVDLPPSAAPIVEAHVAPPLVYEYAGTTPVSAVTRTTDDTPTEIARFHADLQHVYAATLTFMGFDVAAFAIKEATYRYTWKRGSAGAVLVGEAPLTDIPDPAAADWNVAIRVQGNDAVVEVIGERTAPVDWSLSGEITAFAPGGLA